MIVGAILAHKDRINGGLHVVVNPACAGPAEERERLVMGIKHHLLRLAWIGPDKWHPAVAEADMGNLDRRGRAIDQDDFVAPVELIRLTGVKTQRNISIC